MKKAGRWALSLVSKAIVVVLAVLLLPFAGSLWNLIRPDVHGEIQVQSRIIEQKLKASERLEVTTVEESVLEAKTKVVLFGTVGTTTIRYRYTASIGFDLSKVMMTEDSDRIVFTLPKPEILNDGIEALEINRHNFFSKAIEKSVETLLAEQKNTCRKHYLSDREQNETIRKNAESAFTDTICKWLEGAGDRHYEFEILFSENSLAV